MTVGVYKSILRVHGRQWLALPRDVQARYEAKAVEYRQGKANARDAAVLEIQEALRIARMRQREALVREASQPLTVNACALDDTAWASWQASFDVLQEDLTALASKREATRHCPMPLNTQEQHDMDLMPTRATHA
eukprot:9772826-Lingulodinium_polyedra.AAC.1